MRDDNSGLILGIHTGILALELPKYLDRTTMIMREFTAEELEEDRRSNEMIERDMDRFRNKVSKMDEKNKRPSHQLHEAILRMHDLGEPAAQITALLGIPEAEVEVIIAPPGKEPI